MLERRFDLRVEARRVPGVLWSPLPSRADAGAELRPLVLLGHGFQTHKRSSFLLPAARGLVERHRVVCAALDAPGHGERQPDAGADWRRVDRDWRAYWREHAARVIAAEYTAALDALQSLPGVRSGPVGYWGLSLGTQFGTGIAAHEPRVAAAAFGLSPLPGPRVDAYARRLQCPVFFVLQLEDELWKPEQVRALYARIASEQKELHESPGAHEQVPPDVHEASLAFLSRHVYAAHAAAPPEPGALEPRAHDPHVLRILSAAVGRPTPERLAELADRYREDPGWHLFGIERDGALRGVIGLERTRPGAMTIRHIAVARDERRRGLGRTLLSEAERRFGLTRLQADTDVDAVDFYRRSGFQTEEQAERRGGRVRFRCVRKLA